MATRTPAQPEPSPVSDGKRRLTIATTPAVIFVNVDVFSPGYERPRSTDRAFGGDRCGLRAGYATIVLLVIGLNGFALLHLSVVPELGGFIAATLLANMFTAPIIVWAVYVGTAEGAAPKAAMNWASAPPPPAT